MSIKRILFFVLVALVLNTVIGITYDFVSVDAIQESALAQLEDSNNSFVVANKMQGWIDRSKVFIYLVLNGTLLYLFFAPKKKD